MVADSEEEPTISNGWSFPGSGNPDYENPAFKAYAAAQFLNFAGYTRYKHTLKVGNAKLLPILSYLGLALVSIGLGAWAFQLPADSFAQSICIEVAAGMAIFALFPVVFAIARKKTKPTYTCIIIAALIFGVIGFFSSGVRQSFFIEAAVGLVLLMLLDVGFNHLLNVFEEIRKNAEQDLAAFEQDVDDAEEALNPVHGYALGGGAIEETLQVELLKKHHEICKIISSDEPYAGKDFVSVITRVNDLKANDSQAYLHAKAYADQISG
ncbi:hypothetical protein [Gimesia aquarii]|uniref:Uncharacterized protein n=1 Tax=Gimesia aquarii TaxID=2527964 RepID=A0A517W1U9_9PLAN|nr:hypothetical protein [Gimesia aquarii]QDT99243.1 hypothetical protein V144x_47540 [Gimesia aquarii]